MATLDDRVTALEGQQQRTTKALIDHENRIAKLEGITPVPPPASVGTLDSGFAEPALPDKTFKYAPTDAKWQFVGGAGLSTNGSEFTNGNPPAFEGTQVAFIQNDGSIGQSVGFVAGDYRITFRAAQRDNFNSSVGVFRVDVDGVSVGTIQPVSKDYEAYHTEVFTAGTGFHTITLKGLAAPGGDNTVFLDIVSVIPKSEPVPPNPSPPSPPPVPIPPPSPPPPPVDPTAHPGYDTFGWTEQRHVPDSILVNLNPQPDNPALPVLPQRKRKLLAEFDLPDCPGGTDGGMACDFETNWGEMLIAGFTVRGRLAKFKIPKPENWNPEIVQTLPKIADVEPWFHPTDAQWAQVEGMYSGALLRYEGVWWATMIPFYGHPGPMGIHGSDGRVLHPENDSSNFTAFYKIGPGVKPYRGAGNASFTSDNRCGLEIATWEGEILADYPQSTEPDFSKRMVRNPNYWLWGDYKDDIYAWMWCPPAANGVGFLTGHINRGGVYDPKEKIFHVWPLLPHGPLCYKWPSGLIDSTGGNQDLLSLYELYYTWEYELNGPGFAGPPAVPGGLSSSEPYKLRGFSKWAYRRVLNHEVDEKGRLYEFSCSAWNGPPYKLRVYDSVAGT
jgi:hypothetical protein